VLPLALTRKMWREQAWGRGGQREVGWGPLMFPAGQVDRAGVQQSQVEGWSESVAMELDHSPRTGLTRPL
jgi:hypothetical protein